MYLCANTLAWPHLRWKNKTITIAILLTLASVSISFQQIAYSLLDFIDLSVTKLILLLVLQFLFAVNFKVPNGSVYAVAAVVVSVLSMFGPSGTGTGQYEMVMIFLLPFLAGFLPNVFRRSPRKSIRESEGLDHIEPCSFAYDYEKHGTGRIPSLTVRQHRVGSLILVMLLAVISSANHWIPPMLSFDMLAPYVGNLTLSFCFTTVAVFMAGNRVRLPWPLTLVTLALLPWALQWSVVVVAGFIGAYVPALASISDSFISFSLGLVMAVVGLFVWLTVIDFRNKALAVLSGLLVITVWVFENRAMSFGSLLHMELTSVAFGIALALGLWWRSTDSNNDLRGDGLPQSVFKLMGLLMTKRVPFPPRV